MRKLFAVFCATASIGFAVALANANDQSTSSSDQQAGISESQTESSDNSMSTTTETSKSTKMKKDEYASAKSCTDENGVVHRRGTQAFKDCIAMKRRQQEQMGGTGGMGGMNGNMDNGMATPSMDQPGTYGSDTESSDSSVMDQPGVMATPEPTATPYY